MDVRKEGHGITFLFDQGELSSVLAGLRRLRVGETFTLAGECAFGNRILTYISVSDSDALVISDSKVELMLDSDSIDYAIHKIEEMSSAGHPSTPEFVEFEMGSNSKSKKNKVVRTFFRLR